jgi:murein DD-endopeptidase MepM/ murein hydrolase activator NlpD
MGAMAAAELNAKSGAAISPEEFKRLATYIPQANDTVLDALGKMRVFKKILEENNSSLINTSLGRISSLPDNTEPVYDNSYIEDIINNVNSGGGGEDLGYKSMGRVTQDFSTPIASRDDGGLYDQTTVDAWGKKHAGLDVAMPVGTKLPSLVNGKVIEAQKTPGWGNTVVIEDANGGQHRLSHLSEISVKKGDTISRGQVVALSGNTGNSTGPHLDYRIKLKNAYIDPSIYQYS